MADFTHAGSQFQSDYDALWEFAEGPQEDLNNEVDHDLIDNYDPPLAHQILGFNSYDVFTDLGTPLIGSHTEQPSDFDFDTAIGNWQEDIDFDEALSSFLESQLANEEVQPVSCVSLPFVTLSSIVMTDGYTRT